MSHTVATSYTVTIPATVNFTDSANVVLAADHVLPVGKTLYFEINGGANVGDTSTRNVKDATSTKAYAYTIKDGGNTIAIDGKVALKATALDTADSAEVTKALTFALADGVTIGLAGTYTDTLTFTVSLDDTAAP